MARPRVLVLADQCNPEWPSLPIVGYKYARALAEFADIRVVTQIRNAENIRKVDAFQEQFDFLDTENVAAPLDKLSTFLRGGDKVAWSTNMMMSYLPYLAFERAAWRKYRDALKAGEYDIVHRITPMSPTMPSYMAGKTPQPFVIGPLNGNLDWPRAFMAEQKREKERIRKLRDLYKYLPYARSTMRDSAAILAGFDHTIADIDPAHRDRIIPFPEVGYDPEIFHAEGRRPALSGEGPFEFLYVGRLVPYKVPEAAVRAFVSSDRLKDHRLRIIGDGPEEPRLREIVADHGAGDRVIFDGRKTQAEVAEAMRKADVFVFPSIRELGAGVVVEAMASGLVCIVTDYGAPGTLVRPDRGFALPLAPLDALTASNLAAMEECVTDPLRCAALGAAAEQFARAHYPWSRKAAYTAEIYAGVLAGDPMARFDAYA